MYHIKYYINPELLAIYVLMCHVSDSRSNAFVADPVNG